MKSLMSNNDVYNKSVREKIYKQCIYDYLLNYYLRFFLCNLFLFVRGKQYLQMFVSHQFSNLPSTKTFLERGESSDINQSPHGYRYSVGYVRVSLVRSNL